MRVTAWWAMALAVGGGPDKAIRFEKAEAGKLPSGWKAEQTNAGAGSVWQVVPDATGPAKTGYVLAQTAAATNAVFNLCILQDGRCRDVELSVQFKAVNGKVDQGGGFVWRYKDAKNYYVARMNPLEQNYRFYKVIDGKRTQLATKEEVALKPGTWNLLKIRQTGDRVQCWLNGALMLDARDATLQDVGQVGLWTKADARTRFDDLRVRDLAK
jgi:hypothetical protein